MKCYLYKLHVYITENKKKLKRKKCLNVERNIGQYSLIIKSKSRKKKKVGFVQEVCE